MYAALAYILTAYLVGAIPFGLLLARSQGVDVRQGGSGNIGATNVARLAGKKLGLATLMLDILKGLLPMLVAGQVLQGQIHRDLWLALVGAAAVLGHMFPVYLRFRGGKGVATGLGVFLALSPLALAGSLVLFLLAVRFSGYVSLGSLLAAAAMPLWLLLLGEPGWKIWLALFVAVMIWIKHRANMERLVAGTEKSWKGRQS